MSEQPPVQQPGQPSTPPTRPMPAAGQSAPPAPPAGPPAPVAGPQATPAPPTGPPVPPTGPPAAYLSGESPKPNMWHSATSTRGGRWGLALAAGALVCLMILGIGVAGFLVLRNHDRVDLLGNRQDRQFLSQESPGNGQGPRANGKQDRKAQKQQRDQMKVPGLPGGRGQGLGGLGNLLGGTALHGEVSGTLNGSVQALVFQRGEVTAVSDTSITLKSSDGFVGTYGRNAATRSGGAAPVKGGLAFVLARSSDKLAITIMVMPGVAGVASSS